MTYIELVTNAYRLRNVLDENQSPSAEQGVAAVAILNQLMAELDADCVRIQYVPITNAQIANTLTIPTWAESGITAELAMRLVAGGTPTAELQVQRDSGMATIMRKTVSDALSGAQSFDHIPAGSGFRRGGSFYNG